MKRSLFILLSVVAVMSVASLLAQTKNDDKKKPVVHKPTIPAYLGHTTLYGGRISKHAFDSLLRQGIHVKDSLGREWQVNSFSFVYAERNLYDDSLGNPMILTDYMQEPCLGDTISLDLSAYLADHLKPNDTAFFDNINITGPGPAQTAKGMKFVITKK